MQGGGGRRASGPLIDHWTRTQKKSKSSKREEEEEELRRSDKWTGASLARQEEQRPGCPTVKQIKTLLPHALSAYLCPVRASAADLGARAKRDRYTNKR